MRLREFAPSGDSGGSGDYFQALASAWYNGTFDSGSLQKGIKSQQDVEQLLQRGIIGPDGVTRKYAIDYNSTFDGVVISSDDYYEHADHDETDSRTGKPFGPYDYMEFGDEELDEGLTEVDRRGFLRGLAATAVAGAAGGAKADRSWSKDEISQQFVGTMTSETFRGALLTWKDENKNFFLNLREPENFSAYNLEKNRLYFPKITSPTFQIKFGDDQPISGSGEIYTFPLRQFGNYTGFGMTLARGKTFDRWRDSFINADKVVMRLEIDGQPTTMVFHENPGLLQQRNQQKVDLEKQRAEQERKFGKGVVTVDVSSNGTIVTYTDKSQLILDKSGTVVKILGPDGQEQKPLTKESVNQGMAEGLTEFAADSNDGGGEDDALRNYARMWWAGDEATQMQIERALAKMGWEIGEDEGGYDNGGVFVVRAGDINGDSYVSWAAEDLTEGVAEGAPISGDGGAVDNFKQQMANNTELAYQKGMAEAKKKKKKKSSRSLGRYFFPGYGYYGSGESGEGGGDGGGGESKNRGMAEGSEDPFGPQGRFVGDTGPAQLTTTVPRVQLQIGDRVIYKPTEQRATIVGLSRDGTQARIDMPSPIGGRTFNCKVADLKAPGQSLIREKSTSQAQFRTMAAAAHDPEFARKVGIKQSVAREFNRADRGQSYKSLPKKS